MSDTQNRFDQTARFVAKLDPLGFFAWLLSAFAQHLSFLGWIDTRTTPPPGEEDLTGDTIGELKAIGEPAAMWMMPVEFQSEPDPDMTGRLLCELGRLWQEHRPDELPGSRYQLAAAVVNLTGTPSSLPASQEYTLPGPDRVGLSFRVRERYLAVESEQATLDGIASGQIASSILAFIPLMQGGGDPAIIAQWKELAGREVNARRRATMGSLALILAELKEWSPVWAQALEGWGMRESKVVARWINEGRDEGRYEGEVKALQTGLKALVKDRFSELPDALNARIDATEDAEKLQAALVRVWRVEKIDEVLP